MKIYDDPSPQFSGHDVLLSWKQKELDVFGMKLDVTGIKLLMILKLLRTFPVARR